MERKTLSFTLLFLFLFSLSSWSSFAASTGSACSSIPPLHKRHLLKEYDIAPSRLNLLGFAGDVTKKENGVGSAMEMLSSSGTYYSGKTKEGYSAALVRLHSELQMNDHMFVRLPATYKTWEEARKACKALSVGQKKDWDLPLASDRFLTAVGSDDSGLIWRTEQGVSFSSVTEEPYFLFALWLRSALDEENKRFFQKNQRAHVFALPESALDTFLPDADFTLSSSSGSADLRRASQVGQDTGILIDRTLTIGNEKYYELALGVDNGPHRASLQQARNLVAVYLFNFYRHEANQKGNGWQYLESENSPQIRVNVLDSFQMFWEKNPDLERSWAREVALDEYEKLGEGVQRMSSLINPEEPGAIANWMDFYSENFQEHARWILDIAPNTNEALKEVISGEVSIPVVCAKRISKYSNCHSL